ncbi:MAG TPA: dihydroneopterin aldolase [Candidatus Nanoarchaeia archaeon]|nr:dihydroneopterin aldolase [Candidatus Nanoarchaeia archaeon]
MKIKITNLRLQAIIGINDWEREKKQDIVITVEAEFDGSRAADSDGIQDSVDYKKLTKKIISEVEKSKFFLLEKMVAHLLDMVMEDPKVREAKVTVDKPGALRFADSVSVADTRIR